MPTLAESDAATAEAPPIAEPDDAAGIASFLESEPAPPPVSVPVSWPAPQPSTAAAPPIDPNLLAISRKILYAQGVLIIVVGLAAFALGYRLGGAGAARQTPAAAAPTGPVHVGGRLTYTNNGQGQPDAGAVVIVLPQGTSVDEKIAIDGLRPQDPPPSRDLLGVRAIESLGGQYLRSDAEGAFSLTVPRAGKYHLLLLSQGARRPSGSNPRPEDLAMLGRYFKFAPDLLEGRKYRWNTVEVTEDLDLAYDFGPSGQ